MSEQSPRIVCVGDAAIELSRGSDGRFALGCGGDVFNVAIYLARAGLNTAFATALGDDPYSDAIVALANVEGVATDLILRLGARQPAVSIVEAGRAGERSVRSWRDGAPASELFELADWTRIAAALMAARLIYFSGVTLSLYSSAGIGRLLAVVEAARAQGVKVAFDGNFRPRDWRGDLARARTVFIEALKRTDIALPAYDDEAVLWGDPSPEATVARLQAFGIGEIAVKNGPHSALIAHQGAPAGGSGSSQEFVPVPEVTEPVDSTAAGDGFNAGYLAARLFGNGPAEAAAAAHRLAGMVIRHRGALAPRVAAAMH